ncbi:low molecular weight protein-tyrosine-phosphatase [Dyella tabacisoli]|uniref:protein-tyrosine-phosphatase n=1 Tax=Dyella tabacisoli TaxID=2282381 RepID=A0A369UQW0_9GAMM|nr:low molecular weight protein-tyrosine-phosphatase [Dyella tabacisoli]RDD83154.1 low molecular weight phosphotyrosine protein phosphatase [Dyella tabacisoli]
MQRILFVCLGNICRSPLVEVVARKHLAEAGLDVAVASCGTGAWHVSKGADPRMCVAAAAKGYDLAHHRARQVRKDDLSTYDLVLVMDHDNLREVRRLPGVRATATLALFLDWTGAAPPLEFPDPYDGPGEGFAQAVVLAERGVSGLIKRLRA